MSTPELLALAKKIGAKITQLTHYRDNECQLDHARTIAEGRISQANQIQQWISELLSAPAQCTLPSGNPASWEVTDRMGFVLLFRVESVADEHIATCGGTKKALSYAAQCAPQPSGEPVAWFHEFDGWSIPTRTRLTGKELEAGWTEKPLYAHPTSAEIIERCAKVVEPKGPRPCDCDRCYCGNIGDAEAVAAWDSDNFNANAIRALSVVPEERGTPRG
jgi:hypothetical protein